MMQQMNAEQTKMLQQVAASHNALMGSVSAFSSENEKALARMQHNTTVTGEHLEQVAASMSTAGKELSQSCQGFVQNVVGSLSQALSLFDQNMTTLIGALTEKIDRLNADGNSADTTAAAADLQKLLTEPKQLIPAKEV